MQNPIDNDDSDSPGRINVSGPIQVPVEIHVPPAQPDAPPRGRPGPQRIVARIFDSPAQARAHLEEQQRTQEEARKRRSTPRLQDTDIIEVVPRTPSPVASPPIEELNLIFSPRRKVDEVNYKLLAQIHRGILEIRGVLDGRFPLFIETNQRFYPFRVPRFRKDFEVKETEQAVPSKDGAGPSSVAASSVSAVTPPRRRSSLVAHHTAVAVLTAPSEEDLGTPEEIELRTVRSLDPDLQPWSSNRPTAPPPSRESAPSTSRPKSPAKEKAEDSRKLRWDDLEIIETDEESAADLPERARRIAAHETRPPRPQDDLFATAYPLPTAFSMWTSPWRTLKKCLAKPIVIPDRPFMFGAHPFTMIQAMSLFGHFVQHETHRCGLVFPFRIVTEVPDEYETFLRLMTTFESTKLRRITYRLAHEIDFQTINSTSFPELVQRVYNLSSQSMTVERVLVFYSFCCDLCVRCLIYGREDNFMQMFVWTVKYIIERIARVIEKADGLDHVITKDALTRQVGVNFALRVGMFGFGVFIKQKFREFLHL